LLASWRDIGARGETPIRLELEITEGVLIDLLARSVDPA
jgi:hypothetical protein